MNTTRATAAPVRPLAGMVRGVAERGERVIATDVATGLRKGPLLEESATASINLAL